MRRVCWSVFLALAIGLGAVACGGGDNGGNGETPRPQDTAVATPTHATPFPTPIITGNRLESPNKGYAVEFPEGWTVDSNIVAFASITADAFFAPDEIAGVQPSISVSREEIGDEFSLDAYVDAKVQAAQGVDAQDLATESRSTVAGQEASVITYSLSRDSVRLEKQDVVFLNGGLGWLITLTVPAGQRTTFEPTFDEFVGSFELLATAEPTPSTE